MDRKLKESIEREEAAAANKALREMIRNEIKTEMARLLPELARLLVDEMELRQSKQRQPAPQLSALDEAVVSTVNQIWRNTGQPAKTRAVASRMGYSRQRMLTLCNQAAAKGVIVKLPGKWGKYVPVGVNDHKAA